MASGNIAVCFNSISRAAADNKNAFHLIQYVKDQHPSTFSDSISVGTWYHYCCLTSIKTAFPEGKPRFIAMNYEDDE